MYIYVYVYMYMYIYIYILFLRQEINHGGIVEVSYMMWQP